MLNLLISAWHCLQIHWKPLLQIRLCILRVLVTQLIIDCKLKEDCFQVEQRIGFLKLISVGLRLVFSSVFCCFFPLLPFFHIASVPQAIACSSLSKVLLK